ncbi:hypothetical protein VM1G_03389 [Cytospora mali]|uniref:Uncharacterized protein n=1 Tax=Cytospora mali TaxID=578113 RepID=A0A194VUK8_CYTMA|nr:hypothetical protein VM1G_03389 [Valsa mali]
MPPAIEEEEELEYASSSEHTASPHQLAGDDAVLINTFDKYEQPSRQPDREESPVPVVSDIPLVVSDIPQVVAGISNGVAAPPPQPQHNPQPSAVIEKGTRKSRKRKASPKLVRMLLDPFQEKDMC